MSLFSTILQRFRWAAVEFPATHSTQQGARQVTENEQWRRDGAELVDGGRRAYRGKVTAAFLDTIDGYGEDLFPLRMESLVRAFETQGEVRFAHPLLGTLTAMCTGWEPRLATETQNGAYLDFEWIEQRASVVGVVALTPDRGDSDPQLGVTVAAARADAALEAVGAPSSPSFASLAFAATNRINALVSYADVGRSLGPIEEAGRISRLALSKIPVTGSNAVALWTARAAIAHALSAASRLRAALLPDPSTTRLYRTTRPMTLAELSQAVYGTPFRAADLRRANAVGADIVRAGRVVTVLQ